MASPPVVFFLLVFLLSIPFAVLGAVTGRQLYPSIPISALGFVAPVTAAALLRYRDDGAAGVMALLRRAGEWRRIRSPRWWLTIFLLMPAVTAAAQGLLRLARRSVPGPHLALPGALLLFLAFVVAALGEELGWSGYALDPLEQDLSAIGAALVLGVVWAAWPDPPGISSPWSRRASPGRGSPGGVWTWWRPGW